MKAINETVNKVYGNYPEKILQFGEGNFLRAFADWMIDEANASGAYQGSIVLCQPIPFGQELGKMINEQDGVYTLAMRGIEDGEPVERIQKITSVSRCINAYDDYEELKKIAVSPDLEVVISNTTEAGITYKSGDKLDDAPPSSFPAKVCSLLYQRYQAFDGDSSKGLLFLPVELIDQNGDKLKEIVTRYANEWGLESAFLEWIEEANKFTNTLVDRIVTGYPRDQIAEFEEKLGYKDNILVTSEIFNLWVIEGKKEWADILPIHNGKPNVIWTDDVTPYKKRKVRILNGGHTSSVPAAFLAGHNIVLELMNDPVFSKYLDQLLHEEVIPTLDLPKEELEAFAAAVSDRFANPYIKHNLLDITLNCCSKFNARCLPSLLGYVEQKEELPKLMTFSLAAFIRFYKGTRYDGILEGCRRDGKKYQIKDDEQVLSFFEKVWAQAGSDSRKVAEQVLGNEEFWSGRNLNEVAGLTDAVAGYLNRLENEAVDVIVKDLIEG